MSLSVFKPQVCSRHFTDMFPHPEGSGKQTSVTYIKSLFGKSGVSIPAHEIGAHGDEDHGL